MEGPFNAYFLLINSKYCILLVCRSELTWYTFKEKSIEEILVTSISSYLNISSTVFGYRPLKFNYFV